MNRIDDLFKRPIYIGVMILLLAGWVLWLRGPSLPVSMWNVDETIHATIAEVLLDGGTLYRDAIDQRTPLTYYITAAVFAVSGSSLVALRVLILLIVLGTALILGRITYRINGPVAAVGASLIFVAFSSFLFLHDDAFAAHTEWFVVFFTTCAAWSFLGGAKPVPSIKRCLTTGGFLGLAIMSKQSALLEIAPALFALIAITIDQKLSWRASLVRTAALLTAVLGVSLIISAPVLLAGVGTDYLYYTWTYNLEIYGAEFTFAEKIWSAGLLVELLVEKFPVLLVTGITGFGWLLARSLQFKPMGNAKTHRFAEVYFVIWLISSIGAAMAGGRGYDHYFFPALSPLAWSCGLIPAIWVRHLIESRSKNRFIAALTWAATTAVVYSAIILPLAARKSPLPPPDPALRVSNWIKEHSISEDRVFVWGFNSDIYRYADRLPASRFIYCTFQTGLIPWTNIAPDIDTQYAVVEGSLEILMADLKENRPRFVVDSSIGPHRHFDKYPPRKFPLLQSWLQKNYVELEPQRWRQQGFRLFVRSDETVNEIAEFASLEFRGNLNLVDTGRFAPGINQIGIDFSQARQNTLTGLGLSINEQVVKAVTLDPMGATSIEVRFELPVDIETVQVRPLIRFNDEIWHAGDMVEVPTIPATATPEQSQEFAIPMIQSRVKALGMRALFGGRAEEGNGQSTFAMHAPAILTYSLPAGVTRVTGRFGLPDAAYSPDNPSPSDGVEFVVRHTNSEGISTEYFRRVIEPLRNPEDSGEHNFVALIPPSNLGDIIEFEITSGRFGSPASDWSYWGDLKLEIHP